MIRKSFMTSKFKCQKFCKEVPATLINQRWTRFPQDPAESIIGNALLLNCDRPNALVDVALWSLCLGQQLIPTPQGTLRASHLCERGCAIALPCCARPGEETKPFLLLRLRILCHPKMLSVMEVKPPAQFYSWLRYLWPCGNRQETWQHS